MSNDRTPVVVAVGLVAVAVGLVVAFVGGLVSQGVPVSWALRVVVALASLPSLGVLCWQWARWADGEGER